MLWKIKKYFLKWIISIKKYNVNKRFIRHPSSHSLNNLLEFSSKNYIAFPIYTSEVRKALFDMKSWEVSDEYKHEIFFWVERYLLSNIDASESIEWITWISSSRKAVYIINVLDPKICEGIKKAASFINQLTLYQNLILFKKSIF